MFPNALPCVSVKQVAEAMIIAKRPEGLGRVIFFVGAGCSISAGVPGAPGIAQKMVMDLGVTFGGAKGGRDAATCYYDLLDKGRLDLCFVDGSKHGPADRNPDAIDWYKVYDNCFERHYKAPDDVRTLFGEIIAGCDGAINWAHLCLGQLAAAGYISTVLTTNFDQLVLGGMARAGILPVVCDGIESLNRISATPAHQQLVELHGSRHTYRLRNRRSDVADVAVQHAAISAVIGLFNAATTFVAVGYGGREDGVMDLLIEAARTYPDKNLFWVMHESDPTSLGDKVQRFLGLSHNSAVVPAQDADIFFLELCKEMEVGAPFAVRSPLVTCELTLSSVRRSKIVNVDISAEVERAERLLNFLQRQQDQFLESASSENLIAQIRQLRLAGQLREAYALAQREKPEKLLASPDGEGILREFLVATSALAASIKNSSLTEARTLFEEALSACEELLAKERGIQELFDYSFLLTNLGDVHLATGDSDGALRYYSLSVEIDEELRASGGGPLAQRNLAISYQSLSDVHRYRGDLEARRQYMEKALELRLALMAEAPEDLGRKQDVSVAYDRMGDIAAEEGDTEAASRYYNDGLLIDEQIAAAAPLNPDRQKNLAVAHSKIADTMSAEDDLEGAKSHYQRALTIALQLGGDDASPARREIQMVHHKLAALYLKMGDPGLAKSHAVSALEIAQQARARDTASTLAERDVSTILTRLGNILEHEGNLSEALARHREALGIDEQLARKDAGRGMHARDLAVSRMNIGDIYVRMNDLVSARGYYQSALSLFEEQAQANASSSEAKADVAAMLTRLGTVEQADGNQTSARSFWTRGAELTRILTEEHPENPRFRRLAERLEKLLNESPQGGNGGVAEAEAGDSDP